MSVLSLTKTFRLPRVGFLILAFLLPLISACSGGSGSDTTSTTSETGAVSFGLSIEDETTPAMITTLAISCVETNISTIEGEVYDATGNLLQNGGPWDCLAGQGTISGIPAGDNRRVVVMARDSGGHVIYQGQAAEILVEAGKTTEAGEIALQPTVEPPSLNLPVDDSNVTLSALNLQWTGVESAAEYRVVVSANANLSSPAIDSISDTTSYTPTGLDEGTSYYWQVLAIDSEGAESPASESRVFHTNYTNSLGMVFARIPAGTFEMGSPVSELGRDDDETQHQVTLSKTYYLQTTEMPQAPFGTGEGNPSINSGCPTCPVENLSISSSYNEVQYFIEELNQATDLGLNGTYRLPTEAEWEYANRAGSSAAFPNGEITNIDYADPLLDQIGWYGGDAIETTQPVAQKAPNAYGLYDMQGNVWELVSDLYDAYPTATVTDPTGPINPDIWTGIVRGGSFMSPARDCRSANRQEGDFSNDATFPLSRNGEVGFRLIFVPGNHAPSVQITSPISGTTYSYGDQISLSVTATDTEDGTLTGANLIWISGVEGFIGTGSTLSYTIPYYEATYSDVFTLIAIDSSLTMSTTTVYIYLQYPQLGAILQQSSPLL